MTLHIYAPAHYFIGQTRCYGFQKWKTLDRKFKTANKAMAAAVMTIRDNDHRARVLMIAKDSYIDPAVVMECKK